MVSVDVKHHVYLLTYLPVITITTVSDWYDCRVWMDVTGEQAASQTECPTVAVGYMLMYMLHVFMTVQAIWVCASRDELTFGLFLLVCHLFLPVFIISFGM